MSDHKADSKGDQKSNPKSEQKDSPKTEQKAEQKAEQKDEQKDDTKKNLDYEHIKAKAPRILAEMVHMLLRWQKMGFHVPRGVKNIFEFTWDELMVSPQRKSFTGLYCPIVKFLPFDEADFSSTATSRAQKVPPSASMPKANYVTPSFENQQMLLKFQKRSVHLLTELLKVKMKIMIDAVAGPSSEEIARKLLEAGQQLCPKTQEEASDFMNKEPRRKGRGIVPTIPAIQISSTTQLIQQMSVSCLCFSLSLKDSKQQKGTGLLRAKGGGSSVQDKESQADKFDPCPQAREKIREICQRIEEEKAAAIAKGHTRPLILRNYITVHKSPSQALKRGSLSQTAAEFRRSKGKKMYFALPDGTVMIYPSGSIAVLQFPICCSGRTVTLLFQDAPGRGLLGTLVSLGHSSVSYSFKSRCQIALLMNQEGGSVRDKDGFLTHNWSWYSKNQVLQSIEFQINEQLKLKVLGHNSMTLTFTSLNEAINISLTRPGCTHGAKQMPLRNSEGDDKEGHWIRSLTELRRRFEKRVKQFINGVLMISGICCIDYPLEYSSAKQVKFMVRESPIHAWGRKLRDETHATVLEGKGKPDARALISRYITTYQAFKGKQRPASREPVTSPQDAVPVPDTWALSTDCPNVLRRILAKESDIVGCKCVVKIPLITDVEFEKFIAAPRNPHQVLVICILSPENHSYSPFFEWSVEKIYVQMQHGRPSPCVQCKHDPFRFLRYDLENPLNKKPPLLVEKHAVVPGMVVMYAGGKLLFGSNVFNGYSYSKRDLLKQINQVCLECKMGHFLPPSFKFSPTAESPTTTFKVVESLNNMKIKEFFSEVQPTVQRKKKVEAKRVSSAKHVSSARKKSKK